jgi:hypothetical protein
MPYHYHMEMSRAIYWTDRQRSVTVPSMNDALRLLTVQFLAWVAERPRTYAETMEAWRTSCPRLSVWEDATIAGLVRLEAGAERQTLVCLTAIGRQTLEHQGQPMAVGS